VGPCWRALRVDAPEEPCGRGSKQVPGCELLTARPAHEGLLGTVMSSDLDSPPQKNSAETAKRINGCLPSCGLTCWERRPRPPSCGVECGKASRVDAHWRG
jgi:hypothetical protein